MINLRRSTFNSLLHSRLVDKATRQIDVIIVVATAKGLGALKTTANATRQKYHAMNLVNVLAAKTSTKILHQGKYSLSVDNISCNYSKFS